MKFKDIPQFIDTGDYATDVALSHLQDMLNYLNKEYGLDLNPDFQRGHVWTEEQQIAYIEYLLRGGTSGKDMYFNSPFFLTYNKPKQTDLDETILCVDGLQRITSILKFINNELKIFSKYYYKDFTDPLYLNKVTVRFHINKLPMKADVLKWYLEMNSGGTVHSKEELERVRNLLKNNEQ